jgi:hypothetical protein
MPRNGVLLSREKADRLRHVRKEIGRRLREHYDAGMRQMPDRLAELMKTLERATHDSQVAQ